MPILFLRVARGCDVAVGIDPEWIQPVVMTACCSGMLVAALAVLVIGI